MVDEDDVIAQYLGRLGGSSAGARSRRMKRDTFELQVSLAGSRGLVIARVKEVLADLGEVVEVDEAASRVIGVIGSGVANMNPAVVTVVVGDGGSVTVRGVAAEGLIKQHAGEKAAKRIAGELAQS
ncbi:MAG TPA: hypothetical protein VGP46_02000 [Acidimicrobiales bacterium]|nr:hypothetical protein [Acidimicrobiales bacterium]